MHNIKGKIRSVLVGISAAIVLASFFYLGRSIYLLDFSQFSAKNPWSALAQLSPLMIGQLFALYLVGYKWKVVLEFVGQVRVSNRDLMPVFFQSNIAKYIPGSIFEFAARNFLGNQLGWKQSDVLLSSFIETALSLAVFGSILLMSVAGNGTQLQKFIPALNDGGKMRLFFLIGTSFLSSAALLCYFNQRLRTIMLQLASWRFARMSLRFSAMTTLMFLLTALVFFGIMSVLSEGSLGASDLNFIMLAFFASNLVGSAVLVAPAGMGVREASLILLLSPHYGGTLATSAALAHRVISVVTDLLGYLLILPIKHRAKKF